MRRERVGYVHVGPGCVSPLPGRKPSSMLPVLVLKAKPSGRAPSGLDRLRAGPTYAHIHPLQPPGELLRKWRTPTLHGHMANEFGCSRAKTWMASEHMNSGFNPSRSADDSMNCGAW
jgi:hypothetical protein